MLKVDRVQGQTQFAALEPVWDDLLGSSASPSVFLSWNWVSCWLDEYGPSHDIHILTVRDADDKLRGIAPLAVSRTASWHRLKRMTVIGQQPTYGEYLDVIARAGDEEAVARAVADNLCGPLRSSWDVLTIQRLLTESTTLPHLQAAFAAHGASCRVDATGPSPTARLPGNFDELVATRSGNFRGQYRNASNRLQRLGEVRVLVAPRDVGVEYAFDEMLRLHHQRWDTKASFSTDSHVRFHRALAHRLAKDDALFLALLTVDGRSIAARYDFVFANKMWCVQGGWDPEYQSVRPGTLMTAEAIRWGIERGLSEYDFLAGEHDYKLRWANDRRELVTLVVANPYTIRGRTYARLRKLDALRDVR